MTCRTCRKRPPMEGRVTCAECSKRGHLRKQRARVVITPLDKIPTSRNPKPHRDWNTRAAQEFAPKRPPRPVVIQEGTSGGEQAWPKRERVVVSKAVQGHVTLW